MNGVSHENIDWGTVAIDGAWGVIGGAISFGTADIGGKACKTLADNLALSGKEMLKQAGDDLLTDITVSTGTWLNGTKMNMLYQRIQ